MGTSAVLILFKRWPFFVPHFLIFAHRVECDEHLSDNGDECDFLWFSSLDKGFVIGFESWIVSSVHQGGRV